MKDRELLKKLELKLISYTTRIKDLESENRQLLIELKSANAALSELNSKLLELQKN